jgi:von Willebrand factor type A domain
MKRWLSLVAALALSAAQANARASDGGGLDLVLLVDRSGSMTGRDLQPLIDLALEVIAHNARSSGVTHRIGAVTFGSTAHVDFPLKPAGLHSRDELRRLTRPPAGHSDFLAAFDAAVPLFEVFPWRRRAILLITDGVPSVPGMNLPQYERAVIDFVAEHFREIELNVILLPHRRAPRHDAFWRALGAPVHRFTGPASVYAVLADIVGTRVQQSQSNATEQTIVLPPYLESVVFDVFRGARDGDVSVFAPGTRLPLRAGSPGVEEVRLSDTMSSILVRNPPPGTWRFQTSSTDSLVRVFSQEFFPRGVLISPATAEPLRQYARAEVLYRLVDGRGRPIAELPSHPLSVELRLIGPDGRAVSLPMRRHPRLGTSVFGGANAIACDAVGRYWTEVRVSTTDAQRRRVNVFHDRWSGFSVDEGSPVACRGSIETFDRLRIECSDGRLPPAALFRASLSRDGQPVADAVNLTPLRSGVYEGAIQGAGAVGAYRLQIDTPPAIRMVPREIGFVRRRHRLIDAVLAALAIVLASAFLTLRKKHPRF